MNARTGWLSVILAGMVMPAPVLICASCSPCENEILAEIPAPHGEVKAVVFDRICGPPAECSLNVSVLKSVDRLPNDMGNALTFDDWHGLADPRDDRALPIEILWFSDQQLAVRHDPRLPLLYSRPMANGAQITVHVMERPGE